MSVYLAVQGLTVSGFWKEQWPDQKRDQKSREKARARVATWETAAELNGGGLTTSCE